MRFDEPAALPLHFEGAALLCLTRAPADVAGSRLISSDDHA